jgi:hypothetical protein
MWLFGVCENFDKLLYVVFRNSIATTIRALNSDTEVTTCRAIHYTKLSVPSLKPLNLKVRPTKSISHTRATRTFAASDNHTHFSSALASF